jgi:hypothetical protein
VTTDNDLLLLSVFGANQMATYEELTDEQRADIAAYDVYLRGVLRTLANVGKDADPAHWNLFAQANVDPVLAQLDTGETIPTSTGMARVKPLTATEFLELQQLARTLSAYLVSKRELIVKCIGVNA